MEAACGGAYGDFWIETSLHHCGKRTLLNFPCFVVVAHQDFRRLTAVFSDQLIIVLGKPHLVHLSGLTKPLKFNLFFFRDSQRSLKFFECFAKPFVVPMPDVSSLFRPADLFPGFRRYSATFSHPRILPSKPCSIS